MTRGALRRRGRATPTRGRAGVGHAVQPCALAPGRRRARHFGMPAHRIDARSFIHDMSRNVMKTSAQARSRPARRRFVRGRRRHLLQPGRPGASRPQPRRGAGQLSRRQHDGARRTRTMSPQSARHGAPRGGRGDRHVGHKIANEARHVGHKVASEARDTTATTSRPSSAPTEEPGKAHPSKGRTGRRQSPSPTTPRTDDEGRRARGGLAARPSRHRCDERERLVDRAAVARPDEARGFAAVARGRPASARA